VEQERKQLRRPGADGTQQERVEHEPPLPPEDERRELSARLFSEQQEPAGRSVDVGTGQPTGPRIARRRTSGRRRNM
jgi:hypothetical protein